MDMVHTVGGLFMAAKKTTKKKPNAKMWFPAEIARFKMLYPIRHNKDLAELFDRSVESIKKKARKLRLEKDYAGGYRLPRPEPENAWTEEEIKQLKHQYPTKTVDEIAESLGRTPSAVQTKAGMLGLRKAARWTNDEVAFIKKNYSDKGPAYVADKLDRTRRSIHQKAQKLGLTCKVVKNKPWKKSEDRTLKQIYFDFPVEKVAKRLDRTVSSVKGRALKLGLIKQPRWTDEEVEELTRLYKKHTREEVAERMGLSFESVCGKIKRMGLRKNKLRKKTRK